jgi:ComF family protein
MWGLSTLVEHLLDAIAPPRERSGRVRSRALHELPLSTIAHELLGERVTTLMEYKHQAAQDVIHALKYERSSAAARLAAQLLAEFLREELAEVSLYSSKAILLIPLPLHKSRARERGFNQIELVLAQLPKEFRDGAKARLAPHALVRARATKQQTRLSRAERIKNVAGAFAVPDATVVKHAHVFLIDDVATTGATLVNAAKPLRTAGAEVRLLALARA